MELNKVIFSGPEKPSKTALNKLFGCFPRHPFGALISHVAFFDPPLMAQQWPSGGFQKHYKTHMILTFRARRACQERPQEGPRRVKYVKLYWFYNVLDCRHWAFVRPSMGGQKNTSGPTRAPKGCHQKCPNRLF